MDGFTVKFWPIYEIKPSLWLNCLDIYKTGKIWSKPYKEFTIPGEIYPKMESPSSENSHLEAIKVCMRVCSLQFIIWNRHAWYSNFRHVVFQSNSLSKRNKTFNIVWCILHQFMSASLKQWISQKAQHSTWANTMLVLSLNIVRRV